MNARQIFKRALKDPILEGIDYINQLNLIRIVDTIKKLPEGAYISEWKHSLRKAQYEHHIHTDGIKDRLIKLYSDNVRGGNPKLLNLYSKKELEDIIQERVYS